MTDPNWPTIHAKDMHPVPVTPEQVRQIVREEIAFNGSRVHELEHLLQSFMDFMERPSIAGDTFAAMNSYAFALRKKARALLEIEDD